MIKPPDSCEDLSDTLSLCEYRDPKNGNFGFWLYDTTRGMNLSMRAKTSTDAFVEALTYYQNRLLRVEQEYADLNAKIDAFVTQVTDVED